MKCRHPECARIKMLSLVSNRINDHARKRIFLLILLLKSSFNFAQNGSLDPAFGDQGNVISFIGENETVSSLFIDQGVSGRIVTAGTEEGCVLIYGDGYIRAFLENGDPDTSFGNNGQLFVNTENLGPFGDIHVLDDDSIFYSTGNGAYLYKLQPDGVVDVNFGDNGQLDMETPSTYGTGHKLLSDGSIFLTGLTFQGPSQFLIKKYNADGVPDLSFGNQGTASIPLDAFVQIRVNPLLIKFNNTIFVTYSLQPSVNDPFTAYMSKLSPNGTLDTAFGDNGRLTLAVDHAEFAKFYLLDNDHFLASYDYYDSQLLTHVRKTVKLTSNGAIDTSFANNGVLIDNSVEIVEQDQRIITNATFPDAQGGLDPELSRYFPNGALDASFNFEYTYSELKSITTTPSTGGDFLLGGVDNCPNEPEAFLLIAKYKSTPLGIENSTLEKLELYPNPAKDILYLKYNKNLELASIKLYDVLGRLVMTLNGVDDQIEVSHLDSGIFFVEIASDRSRITKKFIKK